MKPKNQSEKKHSFIEKWPEATRKKVLIFLVSFITIGILIGWAGNFANTINLTQNAESTQEFDELFKHTREAVEQIKQSMDEIKQLGDLIPTSSPELVPQLTSDEIEKLKEKIEERQNQK